MRFAAWVSQEPATAEGNRRVDSFMANSWRAFVWMQAPHWSKVQGEEGLVIWRLALLVAAPN